MGCESIAWGPLDPVLRGGENGRIQLALGDLAVLVGIELVEVLQKGHVDLCLLAVDESVAVLVGGGKSFVEVRPLLLDSSGHEDVELLLSDRAVLVCVKRGKPVIDVIAFCVGLG